ANVIAKLFLAGQILWACGNSCVKTSILLLYVKLFPSKVLHILCYTTIALTWCYFISVFIESFVLCQPVQFNWDKTIPGGSCKTEEQNTAFLIAGITNLVLDVVVVFLPMPTLWALRHSTKKRIGVIGIFSLGLIVCIVTLLRVVWLQNWDLSDLTYTLKPGAIYSILEPALGVLNACLPVIAPVLKKLFRKGQPGTQVAGYSGQGSNPGGKWYGKNKSVESSKQTSDTKIFQKTQQPDVELGSLEKTKSQTVGTTTIMEWDSARTEVTPLVNDERWSQKNRIRMTTDWTVQSSSPRR
ncbi:hypothetical protein HYALB_00007347, partial [Hymenoscyphus albidus]